LVCFFLFFFFFSFLFFFLFVYFFFFNAAEPAAACTPDSVNDWYKI
jgi:hypothetical protein